MRKITVVDYEWDIKIVYTLRCRTKWHRHRWGYGYWN